MEDFQVKKILIIEDNEPVNRILNRYLTKEGYSVKSLSNADGISEFVKKESYDVLFFEPKMRWKETIKEIKTYLPEIKIIAMIGGFEDRSLFAELEKEGITTSIQKPFELKEIKEVI